MTKQKATLEPIIERLNKETNDGGFFIDYDRLNLYQESESGNFTDCYGFIFSAKRGEEMQEKLELMIDCIRLGKRLAQA